MTRDTFQAKGIPFDPPTERITHEYRIKVMETRGSLKLPLFTTSWYIRHHVMRVFQELREKFGSDNVSLQRRAIANIEDV